MYGIPAMAFSLKFDAEMDYAFWAGRTAEVCRRCRRIPSLWASS